MTPNIAQGVAKSEAGVDVIRLATDGQNTRFVSIERSGRRLGELRWPGPSRTFAETRIGSLQWEFRREGFVNPWVSVRIPGREEPLASLTPDWRAGGLLHLAEGRCLEVVPGNHWEPEWRFVGSGGRTILAFGPTTHSAEAYLSGYALPGADWEAGGDLGFLLPFGWYLFVMHEMDTQGLRRLRPSS